MEIPKVNYLSSANEVHNAAEMLPTIMDDVLSNVLSRHGYTAHEHQFVLAAQMLDTMRNRNILLAHTGNEAWETIAALIAAALAARAGINDFWVRGLYPLTKKFTAQTHMPVVISVPDMDRQRNITGQYLPEISRVLLSNGLAPSPLTWTVRKGREHYLCEIRLQRYMDTLGALRTGTIIPTKPSLDLDMMKNIPPEIKRRICVNGDCNPKRCKQHGQCAYSRFIESAVYSQADFIVCHHSVLRADAKRREEGQRPMLPNYQALVIIEAGKLAEAAKGVCGVVYPHNEISKLAFFLSRIREKADAGQAEAARIELSDAHSRLFHSLRKSSDRIGRPVGGERFPLELGPSEQSEITHMLAALEQIRLFVQRLKHDHGNVPLVKSLSADVTRRLQAFTQSERYTFWLESENHRSSKVLRLIAAPKDIPSRLADSLWGKRLPILLLDSDKTDLSHTKRLLGLDLIGDSRLRVGSV